MSRVKVFGYSDDNIELRGDIKDEIGAFDNPKYLAFSDGTVLSVGCDGDPDGCWRVKVEKQGIGFIAVLQTGVEEDTAPSTVPDAPEYSDVVELSHDGPLHLLRVTKDRKHALKPISPQAARLLPGIMKVLKDHDCLDSVSYNFDDFEDDLVEVLGATAPGEQL